MFSSIAINTNNSIQHYSFICTELNGSKYCYVILIIQFLHKVKWFQVFLSKTNSFICVQLNAFKNHYVTLTIQLKISHLCTDS